MSIAKHWGTGSVGLHIGHTRFFDFHAGLFRVGEWRVWTARGFALQLDITKKER